MKFIEIHNLEPTPFAWTKLAEEIIKKVNPAWNVLPNRKTIHCTKLADCVEHSGGMQIRVAVKLQGELMEHVEVIEK